MDGVDQSEMAPTTIMGGYSSARDGIDHLARPCSCSNQPSSDGDRELRVVGPEDTTGGHRVARRVFLRALPFF